MKARRCWKPAGNDRAPSYTRVHMARTPDQRARGQLDVVHRYDPSAYTPRPHVRPHPSQPSFNVLISIVTWSKVWVRSFMRRVIFSTA